VQQYDTKELDGVRFVLPACISLLLEDCVGVLPVQSGEGVQPVPETVCEHGRSIFLSTTTTPLQLGSTEAKENSQKVLKNALVRSNMRSIAEKLIKDDTRLDQVLYPQQRGRLWGYSFLLSSGMHYAANAGPWMRLGESFLTFLLSEKASLAHLATLEKTFPGRFCWAPIRSVGWPFSQLHLLDSATEGKFICAMPPNHALYPNQLCAPMFMAPLDGGAYVFGNPAYDKSRFLSTILSTPISSVAKDDIDACLCSNCRIAPSKEAVMLISGPCFCDVALVEDVKEHDTKKGVSIFSLRVLNTSSRWLVVPEGQVYQEEWLGVNTVHLMANVIGGVHLRPLSENQVWDRAACFKKEAVLEFLKPTDSSAPSVWARLKDCLMKLYR